MEVLEYVEQGSMVPPLVVVKTLAKNPALMLSVVKDYMVRQLSADSAQIEEDRKLIERFQADTARNRAELVKLRTEVLHKA